MAKRRDLPLNGLRSFEAAARHRSFTAAAEELSVTHGAVSQQIKRLEAQMDLSLFHRHNRGVRLTDAGAALLPVLCDCFDKMSATLESLAGSPGCGRLKVTTTPFFASRWLIPRLNGWRRQEAGLAVDLHPSLQMLDLRRGQCDIAIRCGVPPWPGLEAELLLPIHLSPLCSPALLEGARALERPRDLACHDLIHADIEGHARGEEWNKWLSAAGESGLDSAAGLYFHEPALALQAAADGLGVVMGYLEFVKDDLDSGKLVRPFDLSVRHDFSYYLVYPQRLSAAGELGSFVAWIREAAAAT